MNQKERFDKLLRGHIVGIVDSYGSVKSEFTGDKVAFHSEYFGEIRHQCMWRWNHDRSIWWISVEHRPDDEQYASIQTHLTKKYGLQWWENGHHDIDHLLKMAGVKINERYQTNNCNQKRS